MFRGEVTFLRGLGDMESGWQIPPDSTFLIPLAEAFALYQM